MRMALKFKMYKAVSSVTPVVLYLRSKRNLWCFQSVSDFEKFDYLQNLCSFTLQNAGSPHRFVVPSLECGEAQEGLVKKMSYLWNILMGQGVNFKVARRTCGNGLELETSALNLA